MPVSPEQAGELLKYGGALGVVVLMILLCSAFVFRMLESFKMLVAAMSNRFDRLEDKIDDTYQDIKDLIRGETQNRPTRPDLPNEKAH